MCQIITNKFESEAVIESLGVAIKWSNHKDVFLSLLDLCDSCLMVSPYLAGDFDRFFSDIDLMGKAIELISTCAPRGTDQIVKPLQLKNFGETLKERSGCWPNIGLDQKLHSKVYIFRKSGSLIAGIVTSANLTESGMKKNNETGLLIQSVDTLEVIEKECLSTIDYVSLADWQINKLCQASEIVGRDIKKIEDIEIGLKAILNNYATPSAGNRDITLRDNAQYFIKVSGVKDRPILPEHRNPINDPHCMLTFAKEPKGIKLGDCLLEVAVGGGCFLSYYACASAVWEFTDEEKASNPDHKRWPYYVYANNLSLNYGTDWFNAPLFYDQLVDEFKKKYPNSPVTFQGKDHFKGALQLGHSYIHVTDGFGQFIRTKINEYNANK